MYELNISPQATVWVYVINVSTPSGELFGKVTYELNYSKVKSLNSSWIIGTPVTWWVISGKEQSMNLSVNFPGGYAFLSNYGLLTSSTRITVNPDKLQGVAFIRIGRTLHLRVRRIDVTVYISKSCEYTNDSLGSLIGDIKDAISEYVNMTGIVPAGKVDVLITTEKYDNGELINSNPPVAVLGCSRWNVASLNYLVFQNPGLIFHELAHLWFGYYSDIGRVDESLATYMALTAECRTSNCTGLLDEIENFKVLPSLGQNVSLSIAYREGITNPELREAIIYYRGAFVFRSLQFVLGNTTFREGLHKLLVECHQRNCNLTDVMNVFENVSGRDLDWFFREWFYTSKVPDWSVANVSLKKTKDGEYFLTFAILDKNNFTIPLQVEVVTQNEKLIRTVWVKGSATVSFETDTKPLKIVIDPNEWVVNENRLYSVRGIVVEVN
ncbi:M1 family aminopeptidase [Thermococcus sp.]|uniref:M1 family aminopeptidase n=1 Tax=Thermococcus sp. TaxID=35749 RepID=UPI00260D7D3E|nr:M1 family aminopeptidase [Thermococcus sp.]